MENKTISRLTRRGWIVLVIIPAILLGLLFSYVTRDVCYVGTEHGNALGYGSCMEQIDRVIEEGR
jgi:hypothetical protein